MSRKETSFVVTQKNGLKTRVRMLEHVTADDLMLVGMKAVAAEIKFGIEYESPYARGVREYLVRTSVAVGS